MENKKPFGLSFEEWKSVDFEMRKSIIENSFKLKNELNKIDKKYLDSVGFNIKICKAFLILAMISAISYLIRFYFFN